MQKQFLADIPFDNEALPSGCLDLQQIATVEITSENPDYPVEAALLPGHSHGWQAGEPGKQTIRLLFKQPQAIRGIQLEFLESAISRTQEYVIRASSDHGQSFVEVVRQQWNFHPQGGTVESEQHVVDLPSVNIIDLNIIPDISDVSVFASLEKLRLF
jgi:hypothetical protein